MSHVPVRVGRELRVLACAQCREEILDLRQGLYGIVREGDQIRDVYWAHKGECDRAMRRGLPQGQMSGWENLADLVIPAEYVRLVLATMNRVRAGELWSDEAWTRWRELLIILSQFVVRETTDDERARFDELAVMPGRF